MDDRIAKLEGELDKQTVALNDAICMAAHQIVPAMKALDEKEEAEFEHFVKHISENVSWEVRGLYENQSKIHKAITHRDCGSHLDHKTFNSL